MLDAVAKGEAPTAATLDSWVSLYNYTGVDLAAGTVDLVAGEIALLPDNAPCVISCVTTRHSRCNERQQGL